MILRVECYAGRKGDERPIRFAPDGSVLIDTAHYNAAFEARDRASIAEWLRRDGYVV